MARPSRPRAPARENGFVLRIDERNIRLAPPHTPSVFYGARERPIEWMSVLHNVVRGAQDGASPTRWQSCLGGCHRRSKLHFSHMMCHMQLLLVV